MVSANKLYAITYASKIIYPVSTFCRGHEQTGFIAGINVGIRLQMELDEQENKLGLVP